YVHLFDALRRVDLEVSGTAALLGFNLHDSRVEPSFAKLFTKLLSSPVELFAAGVFFGAIGFCRPGHEQVEHSLFGVLFGLVNDLADFFLANQIDSDLDYVADHRFDVASDIADFGEL